MACKKKIRNFQLCVIIFEEWGKSLFEFHFFSHVYKNLILLIKNLLGK